MLRPWLALAALSFGTAWGAGPSYSAAGIVNASNYAARLHAEYPGEVPRLLAAKLGGAAADFVDKEPASGHASIVTCDSTGVETDSAGVIVVTIRRLANASS